MIVAIPVSENNVKGTVSTKFSRSPYFAIVNKEEKKYEFVINNYIDEIEGVGKKLFAWLMKSYGVNTLLAYELGIKVQQLADEQNLQLIIINDESMTLEKILQYLGV
ncbi:MAG: NifB/NifX family molybdenum-iron cluster-binding protein [Prolixibacteraceae bacterium]|jgi:predicted Fe-Mo cluster-binding NifX family protein|nr:NifB/NifX family molybdenum-iron cluster-binding protein [Prolixibacteraceae bacterium]